MGFRQPSAPPPSMMHRKAMDQFAKPRQPSAQIQHELSQARKAVDANTAKLRELRLARDAAEREAAANAPAAPKKVRAPKAGG
jgi:hypothetical protein